MDFLRLAVAGEVGIGLLALGLGSLFGLPLIGDLRGDWNAFLWGVGATAPLLVGLAWILSRKSGPLRQLTDFVVREIGPVLASHSMAELVLVAALAGMAEELLFRGVLQAGLTRMMPAASALLVASITFGLVHFATAAYAILAGIMGLYLGALFLLQGSLVAPIITHALYDLAALLAVVHRYRLFPAGPSPAR